MLAQRDERLLQLLRLRELLRPRLEAKFLDGGRGRKFAELLHQLGALLDSALCIPAILFMRLFQLGRKLVLKLALRQVLSLRLGIALVQIASNCRDSAPDAARSTLKRVVDSTTNGNLRGKAQGILREMDKFRGYITSWLGSGPYTQGNPFETVHPPEKPDATGVKWSPLTKGVAPQKIDLLQAVGRGDNRSAYAKTHIWVPESTDARLEMGSDDGIKVWIDDKVVHSNNATRGLVVGQDKAKARLRRGWNKVLVKIAQGGGDWAFCFRVVKSDGSFIEGMKVGVDGR